MKLLLCLLVLLPLVYCASIDQKRFLFDKDTLLATLKGVLGSDATEAECERRCPSILGAAAFLCGELCKMLQSAVSG